MGFEELFVLKGLSLEGARRISDYLSMEHPWLDFSEEVSEEIAEELLANDDGGPYEWKAYVTVSELINWYNQKIVGGLVSRSEVSSDGSDPYEGLCAVVGKFGVVDPCGDGDFWVVSDSFSSDTPSIVAFHPSSLPQGLDAAIARWRAENAWARRVLVINEDGDVLLDIN